MTCRSDDLEGTAVTAALKLAGRGWPVFPCRRGEKAPLTRNGFKDATLDPVEISGLFQTLDPNIAIRTGAISGLVVLDIDGDDGFESLRALERQYDRLPRTASVKTPRGGQHFYFKHPGGLIPCSAGKLGAGLDVRADGGYVLVPPSVIAGRAYVVDEEAPIAATPTWLLAHAQCRAPGTRKRTPARDWARMLDRIPEGERNDSLARLTGHLLARNLDDDVVARLVLSVNQTACAPPLPTDEVVRIVESILRRHLRKAAA